MPDAFARPAARPQRRRHAAAALVIALAAITTGCHERTVRITSEPPGAAVWLNGVEIGATPAEASFDFHGVYEVELRKDGYQGIRAAKNANAPWHQWPGPDLVTMALPTEFESLHEWHFQLEPVPDVNPDTEAALLDRARTLRSSTLDTPRPSEPQNPEQAPAPERAG